MATRKLTLLFEANTREAITGVRNLSSELTKLSANLKSVQGSSNSISQPQSRGRQSGGSVSPEIRNQERQAREKLTEEKRLLSEKTRGEREQQRERQRLEKDKIRVEKEQHRELQRTEKARIKDEKTEATHLRRARHSGFQFRRDATQDTFTSSGLGYGKSRLRGSDKIASLRSGLGANISEFGLDSITRSLPQGLRTVIDGTSQITAGLGLGRVAALGLGAAISGGIVVALSAANFAVGEFSRQLEAAKADQLALIGISSETQRLYGVDRKTADTFYETLQTQTEIAGRETSVSAESITNLNTRGVTAYLQAFAGSGKSLDELSKQIVDTNTRFSILAQSTPGVTNFQVQNAYTSAVTGNLEKALTRQEFFRNSGFGETVKQAAQEMGIELSKATQKEQINVLQRALELRVPQSLIDRAQEDSMEAQISSFQDTLFARRTGIFGIQRDLDTNIEGNQSLFTEFSRTIKLLLGKDGLFSQIGGLFSVVDFDIMRSLRNTLRVVNDFLEGINTLLGGLNTARESVSKATTLPGTNYNFGNLAKDANKAAFTALSPLSPFTSGFNLFSGIGGLISSIGGSSFTGNIPGKSSYNLPLFDALALENRHKPANSKLLVANSSEYIFPNYESLKEYASKNIANGGNRIDKSVTIASGAIIVHSNATSPEAVANEVINQLNLMLNHKTNLYL